MTANGYCRPVKDTTQEAAAQPTLWKYLSFCLDGDSPGSRHAGRPNALDLIIVTGQPRSETTREDDE